MKKSILCMTVILCLVLFTAPVFSQESDNPQDRGQSAEQREKVRDRVETLKMWKLTNALDLNQETASKLFPLIKEYDKKRMSGMKEIGEDMQELRKSADTAGDVELNRIIKRLKDNNRKLQDINDEEIKKLSDVLTVRQMAKYLVFKHDFNTEMRKIISEAKQKRGMGQKDMPMMPADEKAPERP